jgi:tetratricopeptide (TPR) repeat protein
LPFLALAACSSAITFLVQQKGGAVSTSLPLSGRVANALVSYVRYVAKTVWPVDLSVLYPHPGHWPAWQVVGAFLILLLITSAAVAQIRRRPYFIVGWFWFVGGLVPVIGLIQVGIQSMADRYMYLPGIGLFIVAVWGIAQALVLWPAAKPAVALGTTAALGMSACLCAHQIRFWHDSQTLFQRAVDVTANNYLAYNNLGYYLSGKGKLEQAKENYLKSIAINPLYQDALNNLGFALAGERKYSEAIPYYEAALRVSPNHPEIHNNLGNALSELGRLDEAIAQYKIVLTQQPDHADAHNNLGIALAMQGKIDEGLDHFRAAIRVKPNYASAHSNLGNALAASHRIPEAIVEYQNSLRLNPNDAQAHNNLGNALLEQGKSQEAIQHYTEALRLNPNNPEAEFHIAIAYERESNSKEAAQHFQQALRLNPGNLEARRQLEALKGGK